MISPLPGVTATKPGSCTRPLPGVVPDIVTKDGTSLGDNQGGLLVIRQPWPSMLRTLYGDHERFVKTYFSEVPGCYFAGDGARRDQDGYYWVMGRVDDVLNVAGHRLSTMELESALVSHSQVAEAAVVGYPHDIKGEGIYAYVTLVAGVEPSDELRAELRQWVRKEIGPIATPDLLQWAPGLPKTRSGKIMRRILRKIAANDYGSLGDTSTLAEPTVVEQLIDNRMNR
jgi:acetyl-CoA synthetase